MDSATKEHKESLNFIEQIIEEDIKNGKHGGDVITRFPPEPNGYLHIGHAKAICINFPTAAKYGGRTNLRFDDTNPVTEDTEYVNSIQEDIKWLGFDWGEEALYASDYFDQLYGFAIDLIKKGLAYVDDSTPEEMAALKGTPTEPGTNSPYRDRSVEENLRLFEGMKNGEYAEGARVLRAKIDMTSSNLLMRDPALYRIKYAHHHRTGDKWCIYPLYDFAHGQSDAIEGITHSLCSLEFRHHRDVYNWLIEKLGIFPSRQIEFARMNVEYMITSKRKLKRFVDEGIVTGWDDPRMPTISGLRRKGYPPMAIRNFCDKAGVAKRENLIEISLLEYCVRQELNKTTNRVMGVLNPLKLVITNYPEGKTEDLELVNNPEDDSSGSRMIPFSRELYIEREDFMENAPRKYYRLSQGRNVRLKGAYIIHCEDVVKDENGEVVEVHCTYYENSRSGQDKSGVKAKGVLHWVSIPHAIEAEVRLYGHLFTDPTPTSHEGKDVMDFINPDSLKTITAYVEPSLVTVAPETRLQFMRKGYFCVDKDSTADKRVFNLTATLKAPWKPKKKK